MRDQNERSEGGVRERERERERKVSVRDKERKMRRRDQWGAKDGGNLETRRR